MNTAGRFDPLVSGGGALAELIRARDWSSTSLGPVSSWPAALKATMRMMLSSQQPMSAYWGPDLLNFYNDGFLPILGEKHPAALGVPIARVWPEAWPHIASDIEA